MTTTTRHFAHNDRKRILELERRVDRLVIALARHGTHLTACAAARAKAAFEHDTAGMDSCSCGLKVLIETRGEM